MADLTPREVIVKETSTAGAKWRYQSAGGSKPYRLTRIVGFAGYE